MGFEPTTLCSLDWTELWNELSRPDFCLYWLRNFMQGWRWGKTHLYIHRILQKRRLVWTLLNFFLCTNIGLTLWNLMSKEDVWPDAESGNPPKWKWDCLPVRWWEACSPGSSTPPHGSVKSGEEMYAMAFCHNRPYEVIVYRDWQ